RDLGQLAAQDAREDVVGIVGHGGSDASPPPCGGSICESEAKPIGWGSANEPTDALRASTWGRLGLFKRPVPGQRLDLSGHRRALAQQIIVDGAAQARMGD